MATSAEVDQNMEIPNFSNVEKETSESISDPENEEKYQQDNVFPPLRTTAKGNKEFLKGFTLAYDDKVTRRVIAPYLHVVRRVSSSKGKNQFTGTTFRDHAKRKPKILLTDMSKLISDVAELPSLLHDTCDALKMVTKSSGVVLYMVDSDTNEIYQSNRYTALTIRNRVSWKIQEGTTIAAYVAATKHHIVTDDVLGDERFPAGVGWKGPTIKAVLCVPVVTPDDECLSVIELYRDDCYNYKQPDLQAAVCVVGWMAVSIHQNQQRIALQKKQELNEYLLQLTKCYFSENVSIEELITENIQFLKATVDAEHGSLYVMDKNSDDLLAEVYEETVSKEGSIVMQKKKLKTSLIKEKDVARLVYQSGECLNIRNAHDDSRYNIFQYQPGIITRSVLCIPIKGKRHVLGIIKLINKTSGGYFTKEDESLAHIFSKYFTLTMRYSDLIEENMKGENMNAILRKMLKYHMLPTYYEVSNFVNCPIIEKIPEGFNKFSWYITPQYMEKIPQLIYFMLRNTVGEIFPDVQTTGNFIISLQKSYRKCLYHNFEHAFNVAHCMFNIIKRNLDLFNNIEILALMIAALGHDADHEGVNNSFLELINHPLAQLYNVSELENHHVMVTMMILENTGFVDFLTKSEYHNLSIEIANVILATDLALFFQYRTKLCTILSAGIFDFSNVTHKNLVKCIMITACDISGQTKPFKITKQIVDVLYEEFYRQGDLEKEMNICPLAMMDRTKKDMIPETQIQFINVVVEPCTLLLCEIFGNTQELIDLGRDCKKCWQQQIEMQNQKIWISDHSIPPPRVNPIA